MAWGWDVSRLAMVAVGLLALPGVLVPDLILRAFLHDPVTLELARLPLRIVAVTMALDTLGTVLLNTLLGTGYSRVVMVVSVSLQWGLFLPAAYLAGPVLGLGMLGVWVVQVGYRALQTVAFVIIWRRGGWTKVKV
jgi:Na+-driven multidrug efflux pump